MSIELICDAIRCQRILSFYYTGDDIAARHIVEPYMAASNEADHLILFAWLIADTTESSTQGWKEYLLKSASEVFLVEATFPLLRQGYKSFTQERFRSIECCL